MKPCKICDRTKGPISGKTYTMSAEGVCTTCVVNDIYWNTKTMRQKMKRLECLDVWHKRMERRLHIASIRRRRKVA